jgi:hypothetical protein
MHKENNKFIRWSRILIIINVIIIILSKVFIDVYEYLPLIINPQRFAPGITEATSYKQLRQKDGYTESEYTLYNEFGDLTIKVANVKETVGLLELNQSINNSQNVQINTKNLTVFYEASLETSTGSFNNKLGSSDDTIQIPSPYYEERYSDLTLNNLNNQDVKLSIKFDGYTKCTTKINGDAKPYVKTIKTSSFEKYLLTVQSRFSAIQFAINTQDKSRTITPIISYRTGIVGDLDFDGEYTGEDLKFLTAIITQNNDEFNCDAKFLDVNQDGEIDASDSSLLAKWIENPEEVTPVAVSGVTVKILYS